jgi:hypothetical protein
LKWLQENPKFDSDIDAGGFEEYLVEEKLEVQLKFSHIIEEDKITEEKIFCMLKLIDEISVIRIYRDQLLKLIHCQNRFILEAAKTSQIFSGNQLSQILLIPQMEEKKIGKIYSKYLQVEIFSYCGNMREIC